MQKQISVSGIQPTGTLHIGNYLGMLKGAVDLQNSGQYDCFYFIVDLHSLTGEFKAEEKRQQILEVAAGCLAAGLDPKQSTLFIQSHVPAHTELGWILNTITPMGELSRMTQYKDKADRMENNVGLFTYPVLMAADIFLYNASVVPVGDDQDQHVELARTIARKFNGRFGQTFVEPKAVHTTTPRVMSLDNPERKMSKSLPAGCIFIDDAPEVIKKKVMSAVTDSGSEVKYDPTNKPGVSNLLEITSALSGKEILELEILFTGKQYGEFKSYVAQVITDYFAPIRERKAKLLKNPEKVLKIFAAGSAKANKIAEKKLAEVYEKVGLI